MKLGMVGLGRMGGNMTERLRKDGHVVETYARTAPERTTGSLGTHAHGGQCDIAQVWPRTDPTDGAVSFFTAQCKGVSLQRRCHDRHVQRLGNGIVGLVVGAIKIHPALLEQGLADA